MAEVVELRSEQMIPEFEQMEKMKLFDKNEIRTIMEKREEFEFKLAKQTKSKEDILRYIQYEMDLLKLIWKKRNEQNLNPKKLKVDYAIANHINRLYGYASRKFSSDIKIWLSYVKFCTQVRFLSCASKVWDQMLELHQGKQSLFKLASQWAFEEAKCIERARKFLLNGIHIHKESRLLYKEAFLLELNYAAQKRKELLDAGGVIDPNDSILNGKVALVVYESGIKQINDVDFMVDLLKVTSDFPFAKDLHKKILEDLMEKYPDKERTWDACARRELELTVLPSSAASPSSNDEISSSMTPPLEATKIPLKERINNCCRVYDNAVRTLNTEKMWAMYIDKMLELHKETPTLPNMLKNCLKKAFNGAHSRGMMTEKYYLIWVDHLKNSEKCDKLLDVLVKATERLQSSVPLWTTRLKYHLVQDEEAQANRVFREALAGLGDSSLPIWKLMLQYYQNTNPAKAEELFKEGIGLTPGISNYLKPLYLEWLTVSRDIQSARRAYAALAQAVPFCLEMHLKMAQLEDIQPTLNLKYMRRCHQQTCLQFGSTNTDVWMNYVKFEQTYGDPKNVTEIYDRAVKNLTPSLVDMFISEFCLRKAESFSTPSVVIPSANSNVKCSQDASEPMDTTS